MGGLQRRTAGVWRKQGTGTERQAKVLPEDIEWHFIGPLQSNKVKDIAPFIHLIHSIDSLKLLAEVNKQAKKHDRTIRVLLEIHVAQEESKHGLSPEECKELLRDESLAEFQHIRICGLMGMATNTDDTGVDTGKNSARSMIYLSN